MLRETGRGSLEAHIQIFYDRRLRGVGAGFASIAGLEFHRAGQSSRSYDSFSNSSKQARRSLPYDKYPHEESDSLWFRASSRQAGTLGIGWQRFPGHPPLPIICQCCYYYCQSTLLLNRTGYVNLGHARTLGS